VTRAVAKVSGGLAAAPRSVRVRGGRQSADEPTVHPETDAVPKYLRRGRARPTPASGHLQPVPVARFRNRQPPHRRDRRHVVRPDVNAEDRHVVAVRRGRIHRIHNAAPLQELDLELIYGVGCASREIGTKTARQWPSGALNLLPVSAVEQRIDQPWRRDEAVWKSICWSQKH
jgi:hypothetical protein